MVSPLEYFFKIYSQKKKKYSQKQQEVLDNNLLELERAQEGKPSYDACTPKMHKWQSPQLT